MANEEKREVLLSVRGMEVCFGKRRQRFKAVDNVSFDIYRGETFGVVGESGSGKTTIGRAIIRIHPMTKGEVLYRGQRINKVDYIVAEGLYSSGVKYTRAEREAKVSKALSDVGLLPEFASRFPHEFSGGQRQRIGIARALIMEPEFIIADEPISALDVSIRAQVLNLMSELQKQRGLTYLFISHDLSVMKFVCDRIAVIHKGVMVELADCEQLFRHPLHPYTRALLSAVPMPDPRREKDKEIFVYDPAMHDYSVDKPRWVEIEPGHFVRGNEKELAEYRENVLK